MVKKIMPLIFGIILLCMLAGCGGGGSSVNGGNNGDGNNPPTGKDYSLTINVYDKLREDSLLGVSLEIIEAGIKTPVNNTYQTTLPSGRYTIYLSASGYIARGYIINLNQGLTINAYLTSQSDTVPTSTVSGDIFMPDGTSPYVGSFNYYVGDKYIINSHEGDINTTNSFSEVSVPGDIVVSTFSKTVTDSSIDRIVYKKITSSESRTELKFILPESPTTIYSGTKASDAGLIVKTSEGYYLASQDNTNTEYSFGVDLLPGDGLTLESSRIGSDGLYFIRDFVGGSGGNGIVLPSFPVGLPGLSIVSDNNYHTLTLDTSNTGFASYYEIYATAGSGTEEKDLFQIVCLIGTSVKIPKTLFGTETLVDIYVRAVKLDGYTAVGLLNNTQSYQGYSYTEVGQSLSIGSSGLSSLRMLNVSTTRSLKFTPAQVRRYQLCLE